MLSKNRVNHGSRQVRSIRGIKRGHPYLIKRDENDEEIILTLTDAKYEDEKWLFYYVRNPLLNEWGLERINRAFCADLSIVPTSKGNWHITHWLCRSQGGRLNLDQVISLYKTLDHEP